MEGASVGEGLREKGFHGIEEEVSGAMAGLAIGGFVAY